PARLGFPGGLRRRSRDSGPTARGPDAPHRADSLLHFPGCHRDSDTRVPRVDQPGLRRAGEGAERMKVVCFEYRAKYGHFLRAEANANGVTYPVPPRTALLGLIAAVLGLPKDALAREMA